MMLGGQRMKPFEAVQWAGVVLAVTGGLVSAFASSLSLGLAELGANLDFDRPFDWLLLVGIACLIGGGILVQITWKTLEKTSMP
jgi:hypothetical protein